MMKVKYWIWTVVILGLAALIYMTFSGSEADYVEQVLEERAERMNFLKEHKSSPFQQYGVAYQSPKYYEIDPRFKVSARVERMESRVMESVRNSDGSVERYLQYAWLYFQWEGQEHRLLVLKPLFGPGFFLGFADETTGEDTYGGGRYLDVNSLRGDRVTLDFNLAYNPYCAYVPQYQCPLPPRTNVLPMAITAGEKIYPGNERFAEP
jgi:hypothetical protein